MDKNRGTRLGGNVLLPLGRPPTYAQFGIEKMTAHGWQTIASLPEEGISM